MKLSTAIKNTLSNNVQQKDANMTYLTSSYGADLDIETGIMCKRFETL